MSLLSFLNFDVLELGMVHCCFGYWLMGLVRSASLDCIARTRFYARFALTFFAPIAFGVCLLLFYRLYRWRALQELRYCRSFLVIATAHVLVLLAVGS